MRSEKNVYTGLQRFVNNAAILLRISKARARGLLISILRRMGAES